MSNPIQKALYDFESFNATSPKELHTLNEISDKLISFKHIDIPSRLFQLIHLYLTDEKVYERYKIPYILKILSHYKNISTLNELLELTAISSMESYEKELCQVIGQFKTEHSRRYLKKLLKSPVSSLCAAQILSTYPDLEAEPVLLDHLKHSIKIQNFSTESYYSLVRLKSKKIWYYIDHYLLSNISEKERYKVCNCLLDTNDSHITTLLIKCYKYYDLHPHIAYNDVKSISLEDKSLILSKIYKESKPFSEKMKDNIISKLETYQYDLRVTAFLRKIRQYH